MTAEEQFKWLMNFGSSTESLILVAAPFGILCLIGIGFALLIGSRRKKEKAELESVMTLEGDYPTLEESALSRLPAGGYNEPKFVFDEGMLESEVKSTSQKKKKSKTKPSDKETKDSDDELIASLKSLDQGSWLTRLSKGLGKTRESLKTNISSLLTGKSKIDESVLEELHEVLYRADIGVKASDRLVDKVRKDLKTAETSDWDSVKRVLKAEAIEILKCSEQPLIKPEKSPWVIMVVGVNGVGKTTTIGKLAAHFVADDKSVLLCAADTYRAAAIDQLKVWGDRIGVHVVAHKQGSDPAAVAFDAVKSAKSKNSDILLVDTAGRLHSKSDLMDELTKITRVMKKELPDAPHEVWLVVDSTTGQNALAQVKAFKAAADVSGLVVTKLDGTAKGGVILGICEQFQTPIRYIGVGEQAADLRTFKPADFADSLF